MNVNCNRPEFYITLNTGKGDAYLGIILVTSTL